MISAVVSSDKPLVSVLMTAYNREKYIATAIESVLSSTYPQLELIIVDDGSKDRTVAISQEYAGRDPRVRVYENAVNLGDYPNRNQAAAYATGKYLKYVDADDYIYPWGVELLVRMMEGFPEAGWGLCSLDQYKDRPFPFVLTPQGAYRYHWLGPGLFHKAPLSSIIKKTVFDEVGGFAPGRMVGDYEMWHKLASKYPVLLMPQGIVWYREHEEQEVRSHQRFLVRYEEINVRYLSDPKCPLEAAAVSAVLRRLKRDKMKQLVRALLRFDFPLAKLSWQCLQLYYAR